MAESTRECKAILACYDKLVTALRADPVTISNELVAMSLIPPADCDKFDAQKLAQLLFDKIKVAPKRYYDVVKAFSKHEWLKDIVEILSSECSKCVVIERCYSYNKLNVRGMARHRACTNRLP